MAILTGEMIAAVSGPKNDVETALNNLQNRTYPVDLAEGFSPLLVAKTINIQAEQEPEAANHTAPGLNLAA